MKRGEQLRQIDILRIFNQAWIELYCPPVKLSLDGGEDQPLSSAPLTVVNGTVYLRPDLIPEGCNPHRFLLWYFRHELAHVHHCPYDVKTAYSLERAAQEVVKDWSISYLATHIFADLQVNLNYLPRRFNEMPYLVELAGKWGLPLVDEVLQGVYTLIHPAIKPRHEAIREAGREILTIAGLNKPWHVKVQMIAIILSQLKSKCPKLFSRKKLHKFIANYPLHVREDFLPNTLKMFEETYGTISDPVEAKEFFNQWIRPRLSESGWKRIESMIKKKLKGGGKGRDKSRGKAKGEAKPREKVVSISDEGTGKEPHLSSSLSKPLKKVRRELFNDAFWRRYWYKSRAENIIIQYLARSPTRHPVWSVAKYPDEWYVEDDIEALDVEISLDEGPLIPEVTTLKWVEEETSHGQSVVSGFVPSAITILDSSKSMSGIRDSAAIAAFIAYLSARRAGGQTAVINFSTKFISSGWDEPDDIKELALSMNFGEFTVFPVGEVGRLISENRGNCFIVVITDGGWQNIDEAIPYLERIADMGHRIIIFKLPGGKYPSRIAMIKRSPYISVYDIDDPEVDLQNIVLTEGMKAYKVFLT